MLASAAGPNNHIGDTAKPPWLAKIWRLGSGVETFELADRLGFANLAQLRPASAAPWCGHRISELGNIGSWRRACDT
jgi:hypothetical protein